MVFLFFGGFVRDFLVLVLLEDVRFLRVLTIATATFFELELVLEQHWVLIVFQL